VFLLADNAARVLGAYGARRGPAAGTVLRQGAAIVAPSAVGLAAVLWLWPAQPWVAVQWTVGTSGELPSRVYGLLIAMGLLGAGAVGLAAQFLRRRRRTPPPTEDVIEPIGVEEEPLPAAGEPAEPAVTGRRARIVGAYVAFLRAAARIGRARRPDATPLEFARSLPTLAGLPRLTEIFMDARYGPDEPSEQSVAAAERAADDSVRGLSATTGGRRAPKPSQLS
jgi:hypothetical protein